LNFYKHHIGDYDQATRHLSFVEDAAYSRLIRKYYAEEKVLPVDIKKIERLIGARTKEEREAVASVLEEFFVLEADGWHNKRCDEELAKANAQAEANRKIALEREARKRARLEHEQSTNRVQAGSTNRTANEHESWSSSEHESLQSREPSQTPDTRHQTPDSTSQTPDIKTLGDSTSVAEARARAKPAELSAAMRRHSIEAQPGDPRVIAAAEGGVTVETVEAACGEARAAKGGQRIGAGYVLTIAERWTREAAAPRPTANARASPANARDERRARAFEVLTTQTVTQPAAEGDFVDVQAKQIG
jgi:uncharacterized protein YdaU (DUF1376 family)